MTQRFCFLLIVLCASSLALPAHAASWTIDYAHSHVSFTGMQGDTPFEGGFTKFQATVELDPASPGTGRIDALIDIASAFAGSDERNTYLPQGDWFATSQFPQAEFASTAIRKTSDNAYVATGTLTIKGIAHQVNLPFTLTQEEGHFTHAKGKITLSRSDFGIGQGQWATEAYVKHKVDVTIDIEAMPGS